MAHRLSVSLPPHTVNQVESLTHTWNCTTNFALQRAVSVTTMILSEIDDGNKVIIRRKDGTEAELFIH